MPPWVTTDDNRSAARALQKGNNEHNLDKSKLVAVSATCHASPSPPRTTTIRTSAVNGDLETDSPSLPRRKSFSLERYCARKRNRETAARRVGQSPLFSTIPLLCKKRFSKRLIRRQARVKMYAPHAPSACRSYFNLFLNTFMYKRHRADHTPQAWTRQIAWRLKHGGGRDIRAARDRTGVSGVCTRNPRLYPPRVNFLFQVNSFARPLFPPPPCDRARPLAYPNPLPLRCRTMG